MFYQKIFSLSLAFMLIIFSTVFSFDQPILFVTENDDNSGTCLQIYFPSTSEMIKITDTEDENFYRISFPVVCEKTGMIGFTNHSRTMEASVYIIESDEYAPKKIVDKAILEDISPDGKYLLVSNASSSPSLYTVDIDKREVKRITEGYTVNSARYSPDGSEIIFAAMDQSGMMDLYMLNSADHEIKRITNSAEWTEYYPSFTHDGKYLLFMTNRTGKWGVDYINIDTEERYQTNLWGMYPVLSGDDAWAACEKDGKILVSRANGKELITLFEGMTPQWISQENAIKFFGDKEVKTTINRDGNGNELLISKKINSTGGILEATGEIKVEIQPDTVDKNSGGDLKIYRSFIDNFDGKIFELEWENTPDLFSKPVEITINLDGNVSVNQIIAVDEIGENTWVVIPFEYDSKNNSVKIKTAHFSKKGIISEVSPSQIRKIFSGATGAFITCGTIIFITGSTAITLPVTGAVAAGALIFGSTEIANPLLDKAYEVYHGLNRTIAIDDGIYVSWVDDPKSPSNLPGEKYLICVEKSTKKILLFMDDPKLDPNKRAAAMTSLFPFSKYELLNVPKAVIELASEIKWIKNYYKENGYSLPPTTDIWIYKMDTAGGWNGSKLELDIEYFSSPDESTKASRMVTLAHEYWHSVYQYNGYSPEFKWLDECLATTFESQALYQAKNWYENVILPKYEHFYDMYPADEIAESLRTGFVFDGKNGTDADRIKRGYRLWPWGKFLLANQGHTEIQSLLKKEMNSKLLSSYFEQFCKSLLIEDFEIGDYIEENGTFEGKPFVYDTVTGWNFLNVKSFCDNSVIVPGNSGSNISQGIFTKPVPLSMSIMKFKSALTSEQSPLILRRSIPDYREDYLALNPYQSGNANGRQNFNNTESGEGILNINRKWFKSDAKSVEFPIAIINSSVEENWSEYFGYGENPLYAYFLKKPIDLKILQSGNIIILNWKAPDFGNGLTANHCLSSYNLYATDENQKSISFLNSISPETLKFEMNISLISSFKKIGIACVDKYAKDDSGNPVISEIAWIPIQLGKGNWIKTDESYSYNFGEGFIDNLSGSGASVNYEDGCYKYELNMGNTSAKTVNTITAKAWNCPGWARKGESANFIHSWSALPASLIPGQKINQTISVSDNGSTGKNALTLEGCTIFEVNGVNYSAEAGGFLNRNLGTWENSKSRTFEWTVPEPDMLTLSNPGNYTLRITITVKSKGDGQTVGYYSAIYVFKP